jgi:hypothetical protein
MSQQITLHTWVVIYNQDFCNLLVIRVTTPNLT